VRASVDETQGECDFIVPPARREEKRGYPEAPSVPGGGGAG
jgi:hypothetical protein